MLSITSAGCKQLWTTRFGSQNRQPPSFQVQGRRSGHKGTAVGHRRRWPLSACNRCLTIYTTASLAIYMTGRSCQEQCCRTAARSVCIRLINYEFLVPHLWNCFLYHFLVFLDLYSCCWYAGDSEVYVFGWNKNGQLGVPPSEDVTVPHPLAGGLSHCATKIAKVSCGWNHTLATGNGGSLIVWGSNAFGQLGAPDILKQTDRPVVLQQQVGLLLCLQLT